MLGERTSQLVSFDMQKLMAGAVLVSPYLPMLFMGEECSEPHPFLYFVSHTDPDLAEAVRKGRKAEFAAFHAVAKHPIPWRKKLLPIETAMGIAKPGTAPNHAALLPNPDPVTEKTPGATLFKPEKPGCIGLSKKLNTSAAPLARNSNT